MSPEGLKQPKSALDTKETREVNPIFAQNHINQRVNVLDRFWAHHKSVTPEMARNLMSQHRAQFLEAVDERNACSNQAGLTAEEKRKNDAKLDFYKAVAIQAGEPALVSDSAIAERQENWARNFEDGLSQGYNSQDARRYANLTVYENQTALSAQATVRSETTLGISRLNEQIARTRRITEVLATLGIFTDQFSSLSRLIASLEQRLTTLEGSVRTIVSLSDALRYQGLRPITIPETQTSAKQRAKVDSNPQTSAREVKDTTPIPTATARKEIATSGESPLVRVRKEAQASITEQAKQPTQPPDDGLAPLERAGIEARAKLEEQAKKFNPNDVIDDVRKDQPWREYMVKTADELLYDESINLKTITNWNYGKTPYELVEHIAKNGRVLKEGEKLEEDKAKALQEAYVSKVMGRIVLDDTAKEQALKVAYASESDPERRSDLFNELVHRQQMEQLVANAPQIPQPVPATQKKQVEVGAVW